MFNARHYGKSKDPAASCTYSIHMDLPSPRELELETALRQRNVQVAQLSVSIELHVSAHE